MNQRNVRRFHCVGQRLSCVVFSGTTVDDERAYCPDDIGTIGERTVVHAERFYIHSQCRPFHGRTLPDGIEMHLQVYTERLSEERPGIESFDRTEREKNSFGLNSDIRKRGSLGQESDPSGSP